MQAREALPGYVLEMIRESHLPTTNEEDMTDDRVYKGLMDEFDLGCTGDFGGSYFEEIQRE